MKKCYMLGQRSYFDYQSEFSLIANLLTFLVEDGFEIIVLDHYLTYDLLNKTLRVECTYSPKSLLETTQDLSGNITQDHKDSRVVLILPRSLSVSKQNVEALCILRKMIIESGDLYAVWTKLHDVQSLPLNPHELQFYESEKNKRHREFFEYASAFDLEIAKYLEHHEGNIPCGKKILVLGSGGREQTIKLWNSNSWICEVTVHHIAMDSLQAADNEDESATAQHVGVICLEVFDDKLISGCDDSTVRIWNTSNWMCEQILNNHKDEVWCIKAFGNCFLTGSVDGYVCVWKEAPVNVISRSSSHSNLPSARSADESVPQRAQQQWHCHHQVLTDGPVYAICCLESKVVTAGSTNKISIWKPSLNNDENWTLSNSLETEDGVWTLAACKGRLVSGDMDGMIRVWT